MDGKTVALVATCDFNAEDFAKRWKASEFDCIIAVDGGYAHLQAIGCAPDTCIGDFDSLGYVPEGDSVIVHPSHKDEPDLELAFGHARSCGFERAIVYGALGGRLDHSLASLQTCARYAEAGMSVQLVGADSVVRVLVGPGELDLPLLDKGTVSVFSAVDESHGVSEQGMEYPLRDAVLTNRTVLGLSNELIGQPASVSVKDGTLYVFHPVA